MSAQSTLARIARGERLPFRDDGAVFMNREHRLPEEPLGYYHEWVDPTPGESGPGARRVVTGQGGEAYYTTDHYATFTRIDTASPHVESRAMEPISYAASPDGLEQGGTLLRVPAGLATKDALLDWFASALPLPAYARTNWDSFEECLTDLSWLPARRIVLFHDDMPLSADPAARATYVSILTQAARGWAPDPAHDLIVTFPPHARAMIERQA